MSINNLETRERVLVIAHQNHISRILAVVLENNDFQIEYASNGAMALECLRKNNYEMVIMDESCQKSQNIDLLHCIKREYKDTKIICLVEQAQAPLAIEGILMGAYAVLAAPINIPQLATILIGAKALRQFQSPMHRKDGSDMPCESGVLAYPLRNS